MDWETPNKVRKCQKVCWSSFFVIFCQSYGLFVWRLRLVSSCASLNVAQAMLGPSSDHPSFGLSRYHPAESETKGERWRKRRKRRKPNGRISAISTHHLSISEISPAFLGCESLTGVMQTCKHAKFNAKSLMLPNQLYDAVWQKYPLLIEKRMRSEHNRHVMYASGCYCCKCSALRHKSIAAFQRPFPHCLRLSHSYSIHHKT